MSGPAKPRRLLTPFRAGVLVGFGLPAAGFLALTAMTPELNRPRFNVDVVSHGDDVSAHGGATVQIRDGERTVVTQACRDGCDDLETQAFTREGAFDVIVRGADGRLLLEQPGPYATDSRPAYIVRSTVGGRDALMVRHEQLRARPGGGFASEPMKLVDPPADAH